MGKEAFKGLEIEFAVEEEFGDGVDGSLVSLAGGLLEEEVHGVKVGRSKQELLEGLEEKVHRRCVSFCFVGCCCCLSSGLLLVWCLGCGVVCKMNVLVAVLVVVLRPPPDNDDRLHREPPY